jgi:hypothetical protein
MRPSMARPLRIQYPGAVYYVMARGSYGEPVFAYDPYRKLFLETQKVSNHSLVRFCGCKAGLLPISG